MTPEERVEFEHRLTAVEVRAKSNTTRLDEHDEIMKQNQDMVKAINGLVIEMRYMREDVNKTAKRVDYLESKDGDSWNKFKWVVITAVVGVVIGFLAASVGLQ